MQTATTQLKNILEQSYNINSAIKVVAEWNQNRFAEIRSVSNNILLGTASLSSSSNTITTSAVHGLVQYDQIQLGTITGTTTVKPGVSYYVLSIPSSGSLTISATFSGPQIAFDISGSSTAIYKVIEDYDSEMFPIDSIALPDRPIRGILKARAATRLQTSSIGAESWTNSGYEDLSNNARYGTASINSKYKYWTSPFESAGSYLNAPSSISYCSPSVVYTAQRLCNKVVVGFESSYAQPSAYTVQITTDGDTWSTIASTPAIDAATGRVELYRQANGTWSATPYYDNGTQIQGVKINVTQMNMSQVFFNLIELSLRLEADLSPYVISASVSSSMSETSFVTPIGTSSANTGSIELSNMDIAPYNGTFTNDNPGSPYFGMLDRNVNLYIEEGTNKSAIDTPDFEWIRLATMRSESWSGEGRDTTTVSLSDDAIRLQALKPNPTFFQSMTVGEIIWRLLDSVGFTNYLYQANSSDPSTTIPYFWTDGTKTIWDIINELSQATQTAVFFDEYNILQIKTRSNAYNLTKPVTWVFEGGDPTPTKLPDIITATKTYDYEGNTVNTTYVTTKLSDVSDSGVPVMETVWEPVGDLALRAAVLMSYLSPTADSGTFTPTNMASWPFTGIIQLEGEFIRYTKKGYCYFNAAGTLIYTWVVSNDEVIALNRLNPEKAFRNFYNGNLYFGIKNRGIWNSVPKEHFVDITGYTGHYRTLGGTFFSWTGGLIHDKTNGVMRLATNSTFTPNSWYAVTRGGSYDQMPLYFGTRLKFPQSGYNWGAAGLAMGTGWNDAGYYVEINRTVAVTNRADTNEIAFYVRHADGHIVRVAGKGIPLAVDVNQWFDIDVAVSYPGGGAIQFAITINGTNSWVVTVASGQKPLGGVLTGAFGLFVRGWTICDFEYLYASTYSQADPIDDQGYFDRISGGYQSSQLSREFIYGWRTASRIIRGKRVYYYQKYNQTIIDDFSPVAHEVREFDIKFTKVPVLNSNIYISNTAQIICPEYNADSFGSKFILANTARVTAIGQGEDTLTFGTNGSPLSQHTLIYGRTVTVADSKIRTVTDTAGVRRRGEVAVDITSPWIQSEAAAVALGDWINLHWSQGCDEVQIESFGNPLLQLTDVVSVNYPTAHMLSGTHKYFVTKINQTYDAGLSTTYTLRRARI